MRCCRFVELLWQLSAHALREVHRRTFQADVAGNPLPAPLTEVVSQNSHAAALLGVTKVPEYGSCEPEWNSLSLSMCRGIKTLLEFQKTKRD